MRWIALSPSPRFGTLTIRSNARCWRATGRGANRRARRGCRRARRNEIADDAVRHADRDEAVFELARLELRADENRGAVEAHLAVLERLKLLADPASPPRGSPSHTPTTRSLSPGSSSVHSVLPRRPLLCAISAEAAARTRGVER